MRACVLWRGPADALRFSTSHARRAARQLQPPTAAVEGWFEAEGRRRVVRRRLTQGESHVLGVGALQHAGVVAALQENGGWGVGGVGGSACAVPDRQTSGC